MDILCVIQGYAQRLLFYGRQAVLALACCTSRVKSIFLGEIDKILCGQNQNITSPNDYMMVSVTISEVSFSHKAVFNY